ncbi:MAG: caspase family protein [Ignavibacteria bacterium]|nr:caspase family protein [Ignavibacteria bacterium]
MKKKTFLLILLAPAMIIGQSVGNTPKGKIVIKESTDKQPPVIAVDSPPVTQGSLLRMKANRITVSGSVADKEGIAELTINSKPIEVNDQNRFSTIIDLVKGYNSVSMWATDKNKNSASLEFTIEMSDDSKGPVITLSQPKLTAGAPYITKEGKIPVIMNLSDPSGVRQVLVNGQKSKSIEGGQFYSDPQLQPGLNTVMIDAFDSLDNKSTVSFQVDYITDITPPSFVILDPPTTRGQKIVISKSTAHIVGMAVDDSGILEVLVNRMPADLQATGEFTIDLNLKIGENPVIVSATDSAGNTGIDTFHIVWRQDDLALVAQYYALVIGIDKYKGVWNPLRNAVNDAKAVEEVLAKDYGFDHVISLYNEEATRANIITALEQLIDSVKKDDNVLIFYSGHGEFNEKLNKGFWVPVDATTSSSAGYISNNDLQTFIAGINSKHTLLVSDACFSGDIFRGRTSELAFEDTEKYFQEVYKRKSRYALTSGGVEPVTDGGREGHSIFSYYFLDKLKQNKSRFFTAGQLFNEIQIPVTNNSEQSPVYQPIKNTGDEGGQFLFIRK